MTTWRAGRPKTRISITGWGKRYFNCPHHPDLLWGSNCLLPPKWCREPLNPRPRSKLTRAFNWPLTSTWFPVQESVPL
jgi:hypothetical protein